ncbi:hypothetical protein OC846_006707 [Tilletia horrida]|uniref:UBA domain-containing protein n=1 Tax=Tilletia horrida TaxID=155126 RepID=A0AAN6GN68_9BASI|nr:hypothetical protein OC846_006707 [Tilletia horrida]
MLVACPRRERHTLLDSPDLTTINGDPNTQLPVLEFTDSVSNLAEDISDHTNVQFNVDIPVDGNYTGYISILIHQEALQSEDPSRIQATRAVLELCWGRKRAGASPNSRRLADIGFPRNAARHALIRSSSDFTAAAECLILHPELVQALADEPSGTGTPSTAGERASSRATAEASGSGTAAEGSSATAAATGDKDTSMTESTSSTSMGGDWGTTNTGKESERKTPEKDQPCTNAGMAAKE